MGSIVSENMPTHYVAEGHWRRETLVGKSQKEASGTTGDTKSTAHCYNLRRIVDEHGKKLPLYPYFVQEILKKNTQAGSRVPEVVMQIRPTP